MRNSKLSASIEGVLSTGLTVLVITIGVKILDAVKSILSVSRFGVTAQADVYNIILTVPDLIVVVIGLDTIRGVATTYFTEYVARGETDKLEELFSSLVTWGFIFSIIIGAAVIYWMPQIIHAIASGFSGEKLSITINLAYIVVPVLILRGVVGVLVSLYYSHNAFIRVTLISTITSIAVLLMLICSGIEHLARNVAIAYTFGFSLYVVILIMFSRNFIRWKITFFRLSPAFWDVLRFAGQLVIAMAIAQIAVLVEKRTASFFTDGTVAALGYANMLPSQFVFLIVLSLFGVMQRQLTLKIAQGDPNGALRDFWQMLSYLLFAVVFCTAVLMVMRKPVLSILYRRQSFGIWALERTAPPLLDYALWMIGQTISLTATTLLLSLKKPKMIILGSIAAYGFDVCMVGLFARWFGYEGIAISSLITITLYAAILLSEIRMIFGKGSFSGGENIIRIFAAGTIVAFLMEVAFRQLFPSPSYIFFYSIVQLIVVGGIGFCAYLGLSSLLHVNYAGFLWVRLRQRFAEGL